MEFKLFGLKLGQDYKKPLASTEQKKIKKSFVLPQTDDDAVSIEAVGGFYGHFVDFDGTIRNDNELIYKYREMSMHPECESAIDDIVGEAIVSEESLMPVKVVLDNLDESDGIKKKIGEEFKKILQLLEFQTKGYELFRRWYVDSKLVFHIIVDEKKTEDGILEVRYVDPVNIQKIKQYKHEVNAEGQKIITGVEEFYCYNKEGFKTNIPLGAGLRISPDAICYVTSGLFDSRNKRTVGYLHKAIKPLNQLRMMEDAVVIYRLSRAPERRIFYIDVGNLPKNKAEQYLRDLMNRYRNKLTYNADTGEVRDDRRHMSMLEDFWLPRREGGKGTEITTLQGAQNLSELDDVKYFQKKLYKSLNVPISRMDGEQKSFSIGKSTEIARDEIKFGKLIARLRNKFSELFYSLLKTQLILKNIIEVDDWEKIKHSLFFDYLKDTYFAELKQNEIVNERINVLNSLEPYIGVYYSKAWVRKNVLGMNDTDVEEMQKEIEEEKKEEAEELAKNPPPPGSEAEFDAGGGFPPPQGAQPQMPRPPNPANAPDPTATKKPPFKNASASSGI